MLTSMSAFVSLAKKKGKKKIAIAAAQDSLTLPAIKRIVDENIGEPVFVGNKEEIIAICETIDLDHSPYELIDEKDMVEASKIAVECVRTGKADILMRGILSSSIYLKTILDKSQGLRKENFISQMAFIEMSAYHKLFAYADSGINIAPTIDQKKIMIEQACEVFHTLGVALPKIAMISAVEKVTEKIPSTVDAQALKEMNQNNEITGCVIDGPLSIDLAMSKESCEHKGLDTLVGGDADLIFLPEIVSANVFYKTSTFLAGAVGASIITGTTAPIAFPSRSDSIDTKFYSMACAIAQCE